MCAGGLRAMIASTTHIDRKEHEMFGLTTHRGRHVADDFGCEHPSHPEGAAPRVWRPRPFA